MTDAKIIPLHREPESKDNAEVITRLTEALAYARNGKVCSIAIVMMADDGSVCDTWHAVGRPYLMAGALEALKFDFITANIEQR
jgi:hypothetical protein